MAHSDVSYPSIGTVNISGGGSRFGFSGEDDAAAENRLFTIGANSFDIVNDAVALSFGPGSTSVMFQDWVAGLSYIMLQNGGPGDYAVGIKAQAALANFGEISVDPITNQYLWLRYNDGAGEQVGLIISETEFNVASLTGGDMLMLDGVNKTYLFGNYNLGSGIYSDDSAGNYYIDIYATNGVQNTDLYLDGEAGAIYLEASGTGSNASIYMNLSDDSTIRLNALNGIQTSDPNGVLSFGKWKLGKVLAGGVIPDATRYVEVNIDGAVYQLIVAAP